MIEYFVVYCSAVQLLPPSCFETVPADPVSDFTQTVNDIVNVLDEYSHLKYGTKNVHYTAR